MSGYVKTFKDKFGYKNKNNKLMSLCINDYKLLEEYRTIWKKVLKILNWILYHFMVVDIYKTK